MALCTSDEYNELSQLFSKADVEWCFINSSQLPGLDLPGDIFTWEADYVYQARLAIKKCEEVSAEPLYILSVSGFSENKRKANPQLAADGWVIPGPFQGGTEKERILHRLGFTEGWADAHEVFTIIIPTQCKAWLEEIFNTNTLCLYEKDKDTGSQIVDLNWTNKDTL